MDAGQRERVDELVLRGIHERAAEANGGRPPLRNCSTRERKLYYPEYEDRWPASG